MIAERSGMRLMSSIMVLAAVSWLGTGSVMAELHSQIGRFQPIGALWHRASTCFSIAQWRAGSGLIILGADPERVHELHTLNNLLVQRMSQVLRAQFCELPQDHTEQLEIFALPVGERLRMPEICCACGGPEGSWSFARRARQLTVSSGSSPTGRQDKSTSKG